MTVGRKTGGRKRGVRNKTTEEAEQTMAKARELIDKSLGETFDGDSVAFLDSVWRQPGIDMQVRIKCAVICAQYERPRLASKDVKITADVSETFAKIWSFISDGATAGLADGMAAKPQ